MSNPSRRDFLASSAAVGIAMQFATKLAVGASPDPATQSTNNRSEVVALHWLESATAAAPGVTWGVPWARGAHKADTTFNLRDAGKQIAMQSWPLAYWPDGSLKWTAHAILAGIEVQGELALAPGATSEPAHPVKVVEADDSILVDTGVVQVRLGRRSGNLIESIDRDGKRIGGAAHLICLLQDQPEAAEEAGTLKQEKFTSKIDKVVVEQTGPVRAVVRIDGKHAGAQREWLPFTVRLYFYAGAESVRMVHTFVFDGDENKDFISGIGVRFDAQMSGPLHDRHVRFGGQDQGLWAEGVRNLSGLRRDPGRTVVAKQVAGEACPPVEQFPSSVRDRLDLIPAWNDYTLFQSSADSFEIRKRTKAGFCWITAGNARRASGLGFIGSPSGGVAFGLRDFWQRHPTQLDIRSATTDVAQVTLWLWSPDAPAMDLRFYHDGMGMQTHAEELQGLEITYEDYEKGFGMAHGIARTSEIMIWALPATPSRQRLVEMSKTLQTPPLLVCAPETYHKAQIFGGIWSLADRSSPARKKIEDQLDWNVDYYLKQIEQRHWYGFWNYGDVMHSYDRDRHVWRYDVGGFAWDNSELSPDLWLWYSFLRSGRAEIFRMAEAMTRHTGEVDVYHLGRFAGLGSRHNVVHWGDSAKQHRISTAVYRRFYYYLTADERVGDLMRELVDADRTFLTLDSSRWIRSGRFARGTTSLMLRRSLSVSERTGAHSRRRGLLIGNEILNRSIARSCSTG
jgi:hypothetical protein